MQVGNCTVVSTFQVSQTGDNWADQNIGQERYRGQCQINVTPEMTELFESPSYTTINGLIAMALPILTVHIKTDYIATTERDRNEIFIT